MKRSIEEFFIADAKQIIKTYKKGETLKGEKNLGKVIAKKQERYNTYFNDAITGVEYTSYSSSFGKIIVDNLIPLSTYLPILKDEVIDIEFLSTKINNIIDTGVISKSEMKLILKYLNNRESFNKKYFHFNFLGKIPSVSSLKKENITSNENQTILTDKKIQYTSIMGIEDQIKILSINLAHDNLSTIMIGPNGIGKSTVVNELSRRIIKNEVPDFLKNKKIIDITRFIDVDKYTPDLKVEFNELLDKCVRNKWIIFIDNIEKLFIINNSLTSLIRFFIKNYNLKVIGTITSKEKYDEYIFDSDLHRKFTKMFINEPNDKNLYEIINKVFVDYSKQNKIKLLDNMHEIIINIINLTKEENRILNDSLYSDGKDKIYNPELVIMIIDSIFAHAKANNKKALDIEDIIFSIDSCNYIKDEAKDMIKEDFNSNIQKILKKPNLRGDIN